MKLFYAKYKKGCILCLLFFFTLPFNGHTTDLNAGDLLFTGYNANDATKDAFSFVLLVNISGTTTVSFTDNGWTSTNVFRVGEQTVTWSYTGTLEAGREITISGPSAGVGVAILQGPDISIGTCTGTIPSFATTGDQIIAYRGSVDAPTLIAGLHMNVYSTDLGQCANTTNAAWDPTCITENANFSVMPLGLEAGFSAIWIGTEGVGASEQDNASFNCTGPLLTAAQVRAAITNNANWTANSVAPPDSTVRLPTKCSYLSLVLPLNLIAFNGNGNSSDISLTWKTVNEYNHSYFDIEKSADGRKFNPIGRINGKGGFGYLPFDYIFRDVTPLKGANFYRLKIVGTDGTFKYSEIIKILFGAKGKPVFISPNPAANNIVVTTTSNEYNVVTITNMTGVVVLKQRLFTNNQKIDISQLAAGQYSITLTGATNKVTEKLIIAR